MGVSRFSFKAARRTAAFSLAGLGILIVLLGSGPGVRAADGALSERDKRMELLRQGQEANRSRCPSARMSVTVRLTSYSSSPEQVTLEIGEKRVDLSVVKRLCENRYEVFLKGSFARTDTYPISYVVTDVGGKSYSVDGLVRPWRISSDGRIVRRVHPSLNTHYLEPSSAVYQNETDYWASLERNTALNYEDIVNSKNIEGYSFEPLSPGEPGTDKLVVRYPHGTTFVFWIDAHQGCKPVRSEIWAKHPASTQEFLNDRAEYTNKQVESWWYTTHVALKIWIPSETKKGETVLSQEVEAFVDPTNFSFKAEIPDALFDFPGMGVESRDFIHDTEKDITYTLMEFESEARNLPSSVAHDLASSLTKQRSDLAAPLTTAVHVEPPPMRPIGEAMEIRTQEGIDQINKGYVEKPSWTGRQILWWAGALTIGTAIVVVELLLVARRRRNRKGSDKRDRG